MNEENLTRISNELIKIYNYCLYVETSENGFNEIRFFKHIWFGFLCKNEKGSIVVHPANYYRDFYIDNNDNPIYLNVSDDLKDDKTLMIDVFMLHENEAEAWQIICKKMTSLYLKAFKEKEKLKNEQTK